jgi:hypothetical protein
MHADMDSTAEVITASEGSQTPAGTTPAEGVGVRWWMIVVAILPALMSWVVYVARGPTLNLFESGTMLAGGMQSLHGKTLYTDIFAFYGPLSYWIPGVAGAVGPGSVGVFLAGLLITVGYSIVAYLIAAHVSRRPVAALIAPVVLALAGAETMRGLPTLAAVLCLMQFERGRRPAWLLATGAAAGAGLLWFQDSGVWVSVAIAVVAVCGFWWPHVRNVLSVRSLGLICSGSAMVVVPVAGYFAAHGALGSWLYYCFVFPNKVYTRRSATGYLRGVVESWRGESLPSYAYKATFYLLPYVVVFTLAAVLAVVSVWRLKPRLPERYLPVSTAILAVYALLQLRVLGASLDEAKLADTCAPTVVLTLGLALSRLPRWGSLRTGRDAKRSPARWQSWCAAVVVGWLVMWPMHGYTRSLLHSGGVPTSTGPGRLAGVPITGGSPPPSSVDQLADVVQAVTSRTSPSDRIFVAPTAPYLYYLTDRLDVSRYDYLDPVYTSASVDREIAATITDQRPKVIVLADTTFADSGKTGSQLAPQTYRVIDAEYNPVQSIGKWTILVPRSR